jgi:hypothetical protein
MVGPVNGKYSGQISGQNADGPTGILSKVRQKSGVPTGILSKIRPKIRYSDWYF